MSKAQYTGVGGVARKAKALFLGVGGVARKVKAGYVGVGGVARQFADGGAVTVTGRCTVAPGSYISYGRSVDMIKVKRIHGYVCFDAVTLELGWNSVDGYMTCPDWPLYFDLTPDDTIYYLDEDTCSCIEGSEPVTDAKLELYFGNDRFNVNLVVYNDSHTTEFPGQKDNEDVDQTIDYSITFEMG